MTSIVQQECVGLKVYVFVKLNPIIQIIIVSDESIYYYSHEDYVRLKKLGTVSRQKENQRNQQLILSINS